MTTAVEVAEKGHQLAAWVNFNGTLAMTVETSYGPDAPPADYSSPNPIRAAYNVASITDNGTADYTINFVTAMPDANYVTIGTHNRDITGNYGYAFAAPYNQAPTTTSVRVRPEPAIADAEYISVAIFR